MGTSFPLFRSWKTDSDMNCVEATNHKEYTGENSRRLDGCDLSPIQNP